jgi:hypothetical protein
VAGDVMEYALGLVYLMCGAVLGTPPGYEFVTAVQAAQQVTRPRIPGAAAVALVLLASLDRD